MARVKDLLCDEFQQTVGESLFRHKSVLDGLTKLQESAARVSRAVSKAVTTCGCVQLVARQQRIPEGVALADIGQYLESHLQGSLCEQCREVIETEAGSTLFYLTALLDTMDLNLYDCVIKEHQRVSLLGRFHCL